MPTEELLDDPEMDSALRELFVVAPRSRAWERALRKDLMTFIASGTVARTATSVAGGGHAFDTELRVRSTARLSTRSRGVLLAGAGCLAVLAIGVALNSRSADPAQGPVTTTRPALVVPPLRPDRFPLVPDTDPRASAATAMYGNQIGWQNPPKSEALVARIEGDTMTEAIALSVSASSYALPFTATATEIVTVAGTDMELYVEGGTPIIKAVVLPGTPNFVAVGLDPVAFLESIGGFPIADVHVDADGEVSFTLGALPDGYQLVVPPTRSPRGSFDALTNVPDSDAGDGMSVWVEVHNPLLSAAAAGDLRRVDINGISGWMRDDGPGSPVIWQVSETTWASVGGATTPEDALQFARSVTFVDEATWRERYDLEEPVYRTKEEETAELTDYPAGVQIPNKLDSAHDAVDDYGGCGIVEREQTRLVATAERDDGSRHELWIAPTTSGGVASPLLHIDANGESLGYSGGCQVDIDESWVSTSIDIVNSESTGTITVYGHIAQDVPSVVATFESGATVTIDVQIDGYFVTSFRGEHANYENLPTIAPAP